MHYSETPPAPLLERHVACHWTFTVGPQQGEILHTIPPDGGVTLSFHAGSGVLLIGGPHLEPLQPVVRGGDVYWGVRFWPGAASALLRFPARALRGRVVPAEQVIEPAWARALAMRLRDASDLTNAARCFDDALTEKLAEQEPLDEPVMRAVHEILRRRGRVAVRELVDGSGLSERHFRRRFTEAAGLSPKELVRIRRVRASIIDALEGRSEGLSELAFEHGYADQAHLAHEFRRLIGLPPEKLRAYLRTIEHGSYQR